MVWQEGTDSTDRFEAAAVFEDDNSFVLAGFTTGGWNGDSSGSGSSDFAAVKIDVSGDVVWRFQVCARLRRSAEPYFLFQLTVQK